MQTVSSEPGTPGTADMDPHDRNHGAGVVEEGEECCLGERWFPHQERRQASVPECSNPWTEHTTVSGRDRHERGIHAPIVPSSGLDAVAYSLRGIRPASLASLPAATA